MCIAAMAWDAHPDWLMVVAANRDEYHVRPSAPLARWDDGSGILAGRDLQAGGTWLGVAEAGRMVLITNYRAPGDPQPDRASRGQLVVGLLAGQTPGELEIYNPFNVLIANPRNSSILTNYPDTTREPLPSGVHGLSNGAFACPWPKTRQLNTALAQWLAQESPGDGPQATATLFDALRDDSPPPADPLQSDGPEPPYAPVFIRNPVYGTRCSTVITVTRDGHGQIAERRFDAEGNPTGETVLPFRWPTG